MPAACESSARAMSREVNPNKKFWIDTAHPGIRKRQHSQICRLAQPCKKVVVFVAECPLHLVLNVSFPKTFRWLDDFVAQQQIAMDLSDGNSHTICMAQLKFKENYKLLTEMFDFDTWLHETRRNAFLQHNLLLLSAPFVISCSDNNRVLDMYKQKYQNIIFEIRNVIFPDLPVS